MLSKIYLPSILFLLTLAFGFWLSKAGKPYNGFLFNLHKLIALSGVVLAVIRYSTINFEGTIFPLFVLAAICVVALFTTGALMSMEKTAYALTLTIHRVALVTLAIVLALTAYLVSRQP